MTIPNAKTTAVSARRVLASMLLVILIEGVLLAFLLHDRFSTALGGQLEEELGRDVTAAAYQAAAALDGDALAVAYREGPDSDAYRSTQAALRRVQTDRGLSTDIYTLHREGEETRFGVSCKASPILGHRYELRPEMIPAFDGGSQSQTGVYEDAHGWWLSAYAPVRDGQRRVVGIVSADVDLAPYVRDIRSRVLALSGLAMLVALLLAIPVAVITSRWAVASPDSKGVSSSDRRRILTTGLRVSAVVGTLLNLINQGGLLLAGDYDAIKIRLVMLNYLVPFLVASYSATSALWAKRHSE